MQIVNYLFIGVLLMFLVDLTSHWMQKTNPNNNYIFTNFERIFVIILWPLIIVITIINIIAGTNNKN